MNIKSFIDKKFLILSTFFIIFYNIFFSKFIFSKIFSTTDSDFWATLFTIQTGYIRTSSFIRDIALRFTETPETFAYFVINIFLIVSLILSYQIIDSFKIIKRNITFKYIFIVFLSSTFNIVLASRATTNIRWTLASLLYTVFIIKLYRYIQLFNSENYFIRKIFSLKKYKFKFRNKEQIKSLFSLLILLTIFLSIHPYSFYYLMSLAAFILIRFYIFFKQSLLVKGLLVATIITLSFLILPIFSQISAYLIYNISGNSEYILIFFTFILHLIYLINFKIRNWLDNNYPWFRLLLMSTGFGFLFPIPFMLTRIYVPYLVVFPLIFLTFADKIIFKFNS